LERDFDAAFGGSRRVAHIAPFPSRGEKFTLMARSQTEPAPSLLASLIIYNPNLRVVGISLSARQIAAQECSFAESPIRASFVFIDIPGLFRKFPVLWLA
jgi:hypothetical protein